MATNNAADNATGASGTVLQGQGIGTASAFSTATYPAVATGTGSVLRADGTNWSATTATYPNTTTANQLLYSSATNTVGGLSSANNGLLVTSNTGIPSVLAGPGTTGQVLQANSAAAPSFSTASYPSTTTSNQILYSSSGNTVAGLATANSGALVTSAGGVPSISSTLPSAVQGNITSVGALSSGSLTTGFTAVAVPQGGTGQVTLTNHGVLVGAGTSNVTQLAAGSSGQVLQSGGAAADPVYSTATYPVSTTVNQILYSSSANAITGLSTANNGALITSGGGVPSISSTLPTAVQGNITSVGALASGSLTTGFTAVAVAQGGTGQTTLTNHGVLVGAATSAITQLAAGTSGQVLQSGGAAADPAYSTATYPATATSTGTILRADGTNWSATTATYPNTTTSQQILYSTAANVIGQLTTANSKFPATNSSGTLAMRALSVTRQVFTSTGTYTPTAGMVYCDIQLVGGGGGGGGTAAGAVGSSGAGGGGGAGGYAQGTFSSSTIGASQAVTIGAAGTAGAAGANPGGAGGTTSVGALISATGGGGGGASTPASVQAASGGTGGTGSNGDVQVAGQNGGTSFAIGLSTNPLAVSGFGASGFFGAGGESSSSGGAAVAGGGGTSFGAGGSGAAVGNSATTAAGGVGTKGFVMVTEYIIA